MKTCTRLLLYLCVFVECCVCLFVGETATNKREGSSKLERLALYTYRSNEHKWTHTHAAKQGQKKKSKQSKRWEFESLPSQAKGLLICPLYVKN